MNTHRQQIVLFDLENTLIWDWSDRRLMSLSFPAIKEFVDMLPSDFIAGVFSFAIWNSNDLHDFNTTGLREGIENHFGFKFNDDWIFLRDDLLQHFRVFLKMPFLDKDDLFSFFDKQTIIERLWLEDWCDKFDNTDILLFDDTVKDMKIHRGNNSLEFVNPWTIIHNN